MPYKKLTSREKRKVRIRKKIFGTSERPRLSVFRSNRYVYVQLIDDVNQKTLAEASSLKKEQGNNKSAAVEVGQLIAEKAKAKNIQKVVFDRNGFQYHGVIKEMADSAREAGLVF